MAPQYEYNPNKVQASIEVFPREGNVEFIVGKPKAFMKADGSNWGVRYALHIPSKDKNTSFACYLHNDGGESMTKRFQMACIGGYGKGKAEEARFNAEHGNDDWRLDFETGECGEGWKQLTGSRVIADIEVTMNTNTKDEQNNFNNWRSLSPVSA